MILLDYFQFPLEASVVNGALPLIIYPDVPPTLLPYVFHEESRILILFKTYSLHKFFFRRLKRSKNYKALRLQTRSFLQKKRKFFNIVNKTFLKRKLRKKKQIAFPYFKKKNFPGQTFYTKYYQHFLRKYFFGAKYSHNIFYRYFKEKLKDLKNSKHFVAYTVLTVRHPG